MSSSLLSSTVEYEKSTCLSINAWQNAHSSYPCQISSKLKWWSRTHSALGHPSANSFPAPASTQQTCNLWRLFQKSRHMRQLNWIWHFFCLSDYGADIGFHIKKMTSCCKGASRLPESKVTRLCILHCVLTDSKVTNVCQSSDTGINPVSCPTVVSEFRRSSRHPLPLVAVR